MMHPNPYLLLLSGLNFSVADLYANRRGELSEAQRMRLTHLRYREIDICLLALTALLVTGFSLHIRGVVVLFCSTCVVSMIMTIRVQYGEDLKGQVQKARGYVSFLPTWGVPFRPRYQLLIGGTKLLAYGQIKEAFESRCAYTIYYTQNSRSILSAEVIA